jgi:hypothetical protein
MGTMKNAVSGVSRPARAVYQAAKAVMIPGQAEKKTLFQIASQALG